MLLRPKFMGGAEVNERQKNAIDAMNRSIEKLQALVDDVILLLTSWWNNYLKVGERISGYYYLVF